MLYKANFKPSQLLDVLSNTWLAKDAAVSARLDNGARYGFASAATCVEDEALRISSTKAGKESLKLPTAAQASNSKQQSKPADGDSSEEDEDSEDDDDAEPSVPFPHPPPPGFLDPTTLDPQTLGMTLVLDSQAQSRGVVPLMVSRAAADRRLIMLTLAARRCQRQSSDLAWSRLRAKS